MPSTSSRTRYSATVSAVALVMVAIGCDSGPKISVYKVDRADSEVRTESPPPAVAVTEQIHGAIVPNGDSAWFFKLRGDAELTRKFSDEFRQIVEGVKFESGEPKWTLPEQWKDAPGGGFTYAKWVEQSSGLVATVSVLSINDDWQSYLVMNINRWRGQVSLPGQQWDAMEQELEVLDTLSTEQDRPAYYVSMTGKGGQGSMGGAPFLEAMRRAQQAKAAAEADGDAASDKAANGDVSDTAPEITGDEPIASGEMAGGKDSSQPKPLQYVVPEGWSEVPPKNSMRKAQFEATAEGQAVEVIVSQAGGAIEQNMGMWLGQVGGKPSEESVASIVKAASTVETKTGTAAIYQIVGKEHGGEKSESMLLAEIPITDSYSWFVKMVGDADAVDGLSDSFEEFVRSVEFDKPE